MNVLHNLCVAWQGYLSPTCLVLYIFSTLRGVASVGVVKIRGVQRRELFVLSKLCSCFCDMNIRECVYTYMLRGKFLSPACLVDMFLVYICFAERRLGSTVGIRFYDSAS